MELPEVLLVLAAGLAAGTVNAVAGGGSLITFPALIAVGLPPVAANVSNSIAVCPGYLASVAASRADLPDRRWLMRLVPGAVLGTAAGGFLLLTTPARAFELVVPFLVLGATAVLAFQDRLRRLVAGAPPGRPAPATYPVPAVTSVVDTARWPSAATDPGSTTRAVTGPARRLTAVQVMVAVGAVYGGYFGAALGVMLVAGLALVLDETLARISAIKNVLSAVVGLTTTVVFAVFGPVDWTAVALVAPATIVGGYAGAWLVRRLPSAVLKTVIVVFGTSVGLLLLYRALG
ncbi:sulfite exporter TauE/SafE family protein [Plantactinospora sp. B5E13]|uniref:sulfite exporter TauE/SafE family protein n=1 Tax=Plantactinospora sp. B5E13 TaxID=3153758 RepID=UPI00325EBAA7